MQTMNLCNDILVMLVEGPLSENEVYGRLCALGGFNLVYDSLTMLHGQGMIELGNSEVRWNGAWLDNHSRRISGM